MRRFLSLFAALLAVSADSAAAPGQAPAFRMEILVDGRPVRQYPARSAVYIEALKGKEYAIRLHNPLNIRVAVALSVDGLNTIDARRTSAADARKWVLDPHETITISGWQTDMNHARRFYFTTEKDSYAEWLGKTENAGVVTAVFFRERQARIDPIVQAPIERDSRNEGKGAALPAAAQASSVPSRAAEEFAATGIGDSTSHPVRRIHMDLEEVPAATLGVRYEFRAQLVRLGVLPPAPAVPDALTRREGASGFEPGFCPEPPIIKRR